MARGNTVRTVPGDDWRQSWGPARRSTLRFAETAVSLRQAAVVRDVWAQVDEGTYTGRYPKVAVAAHGPAH